MSVEVQGATKDVVVQASRIVLAIVLPSIFLAFCILAFFVKPLAADPPRKKGDRLDFATTGTVRPAVARAPLIDDSDQHIVSGYGIDGW